MRREIRIAQSHDRLEMIIPKIGPWDVLFVTGIWCVIWTFIFGSLIINGVILQYPDMVPHVTGFALLWLFILRIFLWNAVGHEKVILTSTHLTIKRAGTFLTLTRKYELELIDEFRFAYINDVPRFSLRYGFAGGHIEFSYWERPEYFGQSLTKEESLKLADQLNKWLELRKMN